MWGIKNDTKQKQTHRQKANLSLPKGIDRERINQETEMNISTLLYIKQISNKGLLYRTRNSTQNFVINSKESNPKKNIYIYQDHFAVHLKLTQGCKSTIPE